MTRIKRDNLTYCVISLVSVIFLTCIIPTFTPPYPGYGVSSRLLPNVVFGIILVLSVLPLAQNLLAYRKKKWEDPAIIVESQPEDIPQEDRVYLWNLVSFMLPCLLLMPVMRWVGFLFGGFVFMLLMQYLCGQRKPVTMVIVAFCTVGLSYAAMRYGLGIPMP